MKISVSLVFHQQWYDCCSACCCCCFEQLCISLTFQCAHKHFGCLMTFYFVFCSEIYVLLNSVFNNSLRFTTFSLLYHNDEFFLWIILFLIISFSSFFCRYWSSIDGERKNQYFYTIWLFHFIFLCVCRSLLSLVYRCYNKISLEFFLYIFFTTHTFTESHNQTC